MMGERLALAGGHNDDVPLWTVLLLVPNNKHAYYEDEEEERRGVCVGGYFASFYY